MTMLASLFVLLSVGVPVPLWSPILAASDTTEDVALLSITAHEETGGSWDCSRVGDQNRSYSCWQLMVFGDTRRRVQADTNYAAALAMERIRSSMRRCAGQLTEYLRGNCEPLQQATQRLVNVRRAMR
jgi:hypothetical protein